MVGKFLVAWIATQPDLVALVSTRIEPQASATSTDYPRIVFVVIADDTLGAMDGPGGISGKLVQIDVLSRRWIEANKIAAMIKGGKVGPYRNRLDGYRGTLADVVVQAALFEDRRDVYDDPIAGETQGVHRVSQDFTIWHEE